MTNNRSSLNYAPMSNEQLMVAAPSIFASEAYHKMSSKYAFIPTIQVVDKMRSEGFVPVKASQSRTRIEGKAEFTKHMIRFRDVRNGDAPMMRELGQLYPELVLTNAHDGASAYVLDAGIFRLICLNGLMVEDSNISKIRVTHRGGKNAADAVIEASYQVVEEFPAIMESVARFGALQLSAPQQEAFATAALTIRYDEQAPVTAERILRPNRHEDRNPTVWNTFNVLQENLVNGGIRTYDADAGRRKTTRAVQGISESSRLNKALWVLTETMAKLVTQS